MLLSALNDRSAEAVASRGIALAPESPDAYLMSRPGSPQIR